jgi:hypothetical protein
MEETDVTDLITSELTPSPYQYHIAESTRARLPAAPVDVSPQEGRMELRNALGRKLRFKGTFLLTHEMRCLLKDAFDSPSLVSA